MLVKVVIKMIKKIVILLGIAFSMAIGVGMISANTSTVKVEVISRNIEKHTINVKTDDHNEDRFTLKKVSAAQMKIADKGSIIKVTYDDDFNISSLEKVKATPKKSSDDDQDYKNMVVGAFMALGLLALGLLLFAPKPFD